MEKMPISPIQLRVTMDMLYSLLMSLVCDPGFICVIRVMHSIHPTVSCMLVLSFGMHFVSDDFKH